MESLKSVKVLAPHHVARVEEMQTRFYDLMNASQALMCSVRDKLIGPTDKLSEVVTKGAALFAKDSSQDLVHIKQQACLARVKMLNLRTQMQLLHLEQQTNELLNHINELKAWDLLSPILDSCPE